MLVEFYKMKSEFQVCIVINSIRYSFIKKNIYWVPTEYYFANKGPSSKNYGFSNSHVWMWELDHKESWAPKNWCFQTVMLQKTPESPLDCKEIQPAGPYENQTCIFAKRTDAKAPILWPPDAKNWLMLRKIEGRAEGDNGGWDGWMVSPTQWTWVWASSGSWWWMGSLACCRPWGRKESDTSEWLKWTELSISHCAGHGI